MSGRALRRLREEKEAAALVELEEDASLSDEDEDTGGAFMAYLNETSSEDESSDDDDSADEKADVVSQPPVAVAQPPRSKKNNPKEEEEEDLDAILFDLNITAPNGLLQKSADEVNDIKSSTVRSLLLSKQRGYDTQDLDLDYGVRSLLGGGDMGEDDMDPQMAQGGRRRGGRNNRGRSNRVLAKKYLFQKPKVEWGKPPSYVGGGIGMRELTPELIHEERKGWCIPGPYNLTVENTDDGIPAISTNEQKWYTLQMSDTYHEINSNYQQLISTGTQAAPGGGTLHDPNALAMFVADNPYFCETLLQLAMVLLYVNDRTKGNDLLRRCLFVYESALSSSVLPNDNPDCTHEILVDIDREPNSGLFATLFRVMQVSGMSGCHMTALATGRFLLSLDFLRDPMGVLLILDYYALASRKVLDVGKGEVELGSRFIVDLVDSEKINIHYKDPLTDRHHWCKLGEMPNWAYSYALALYRLSHDKNKADDGEEKTLAQKADEALGFALTQFPHVLPKLLAMNKVNTQDRSFRTDWPSVMPYFKEESIAETTQNVEERISNSSGAHLVRIFVQRCHKLWKEDDVVSWLYKCALKLVKSHTANKTVVYAKSSEEEKVESEEEVVLDTSKVTRFITKYSLALARYAQCDPSEYEDKFQTFPPEAIALDPNIVAPAMVLGDGRRGRFLRRQQQQQPRGRQGLEGPDPIEIVRQLLGMGGGGVQEMELLDPDSPILQLYLQSLLPWAQVDGIAPPRQG